MQNSEILAVRIDKATIERINAVRVKLQERNPGLTVSQSDCVRALILQALTLAEGQ